MDKKIQGRKKRVILGYKAMTMLYIAVEVFSASKRVPVNTLLGITSYIAMPAGLSYILISAAKHDRLGSDTYKRLNLSLLEYAVIGLFVIALSGGGNPILKVAYIMTLINTIKGYTYGVVGWDKKSGTDTTLLQISLEELSQLSRVFVQFQRTLHHLGIWLLLSW